MNKTRMTLVLVCAALSFLRVEAADNGIAYPQSLSGESLATTAVLGAVIASAITAVALSSDGEFHHAH